MRGARGTPSRRTVCPPASLECLFRFVLHADSLFFWLPTPTANMALRRSVLRRSVELQTQREAARATVRRGRCWAMG